MRLIKAQSTNLRSIGGRGVKYDINSTIQLDSNVGAVMPTGSTLQRSDFPINGTIRYNTDTDSLEAYADGTWKKIRRVEATTITQQNLGNGDASETFFGPLDSGDDETPIPTAAQNILVFVENVFQIATTNYTLVQNPAGKIAGWYLEFSSAPDLGKPVTVLHNFDK